MGNDHPTVPAPLLPRLDPDVAVDRCREYAVGFLLAALHGAGFATLTHTPSPMKWVSQVLERPAHERPFALIPVGYPSESPGARHIP